MDDIQGLLQLQSSLITDQPIKIPFEAEDTSMLPEGISYKEIIITPAKVGTVFRITPLLAKIDKADLDNITVNHERKFAPEAIELFDKYSDTVLEVICLGIHNQQSEYPDYLKDFLSANSTWEDLHILLNAILFRLGSLGFINSTTHMKRVGLTDAAEMIALQKNLESHSVPSQS